MLLPRQDWKEAVTTSIPAPLPPGPPPPTAEDIGTRIAMGRRMRRWTQAEFAARMLAVDPEGNWTYAKVSKAERGEQSVDAEVLGLIAMVQGLAITWYYELPYDGGSPGPWGTRVMGP